MHGDNKRYASNRRDARYRSEETTVETPAGTSAFEGKSRKYDGYASKRKYE